MTKPSPPDTREPYATFGYMAILAYALIVIALNFPGYMTLDSTTQLQQARTMVLSDGHPPAMALLWSITDAVVPGPFPMLVLSTLLHGFGLWWMSGLVCDRYARLAIFVTTALFPSTFWIAGTIWKDTLMNGCLFMMAGCAVNTAKALFAQNTPKIRLWMGTGIFFAFLATSMRHNAPAAVTVLLCLYTLFAFRLLRKATLTRHSEQSDFASNILSAPLIITWQQILASISASIVAGIMLLLASVFIFGQFVTQKQHFWQVLAFHDLAGISVQTDRLAIPEELYEGISQDIIKTHYLDYSVLSLTKDSGVFRYLVDEAELDILKDAWLHGVTNETGAYLRHRKGTFTELLGAGRIHPWAPIVRDPVPAIRASVYPSIAASFQHPMRKSIYDWAVYKQPWIFEPWLFFLATIFILLALALTWWRTKALSIQIAILTTIISSGLAYEASLFFITPSPDFRYSSYMIMTTVFSVGVITSNALRHFKAGDRLRHWVLKNITKAKRINLKATS